MIRSTEMKQDISNKSRVDIISSVPILKAFATTIPDDLNCILKHSNFKPFPQMTENAKNYWQIIKNLKYYSINNLKPDMYWYLYKLLLYIEQHRCITEMKKYTLFNQKITKSKYRKDEYVINVPGLSEDRPSLRANDFILITGTNSCTLNDRCIIKYVGSNYVTIKPSLKFQEMLKPDDHFHIEFEYSDWSNDIQHLVLNTAHKNKLINLVFPVAETLPKIKHEPVKWINSTLSKNPEQQQAVLNILAKSSRPAPYLVFGPPGTGKSTTLVEAIIQIHQRNPNHKVLICTPSNSAADEIAKRLINSSISDNSIYRMYSASKKHEDIDENIKTCSNFATNEAVYITKKVFITKKIVITTLATCIRILSYNLREDHFEYLFIDEAGQATEPETLIPLLIMSGEKQKSISGQIVIAGDPKQLGPVCQSILSECLLGISMLERLMMKEPYIKIPGIGYDPNYVTKLVKNYRSHSAILNIPNELFYDNDLVAMGGIDTTKGCNWIHLPNKKFPIIFHAVTKSNETRESNSPSVCNLIEINIIMEYIDKLLKTKLNGIKVEENDIGIVTPYALQRNKIHTTLNKKNLKNISVGTVETFQGQERDIIIISTVRTVLYQHGNTYHPGFLSNPKRFNVAITRAKSLLIVIGNPMVLKYDNNWKEFMQYCKNNNACRGATFDLKKNLSHSELRSMLAKKHDTITVNPHASIPIVEDPRSAFSYDINEDKPSRKMRLPIGPLPKRYSQGINDEDDDDDDDDDDEEYLSVDSYYLIKEGEKYDDDDEMWSLAHEYDDEIKKDEEHYEYVTWELSDDDSQSDTNSIKLDSNKTSSEFNNVVKSIKPNKNSLALLNQKIANLKI